MFLKSVLIFLGLIGIYALYDLYKLLKEKDKE